MYKHYVLLLTVFAVSTVVSAAETMNLSTAEALALERDSVLRAKHAQADAYRQQAVAEDTLPDPRLRLGLLNVPTDTYALDQEAMTQIQVGVQQVIPRGSTLELKSRRALTTSTGLASEAEDRVRQVRLQTRTAYLELLYWLHAEQVVRNSDKLFQQLVDVTESQYAAGLQKQQDVIRAQLEMGMLDDKLDEVIARQEGARAELARLIGREAAAQVHMQDLPALHAVQSLADAEQQLLQHPRIKNENAKIDNSQLGIELARQEYKPDWMLEFNYGFRDGYNPNGTDRADFVSAMVSFDLPLFTAERQDRKVAASRLQHQASMDAREETLRMLRQELDQTRADWERLAERVRRYQQVIVPQARESAKAALYGYQNRRGEFTALMRARITELDTELNYLRLQINHLKAQAKLLYLLGDAQ